MRTELSKSIVSLLEAPAPAVLTTTRRDGTAVSSPVWFRRAGDVLEVVVADDDVKLQHLQRHPRCALLVFESVPPFRGVRIEGAPTLSREHVDEARLAIATRYLGTEKGRAFTAARGSGTVLAMPLSRARTWDLERILP